MAPIVVRDRVIVGASGGEFGIYGWIKGLDLNTGQVVWTARNMGPDADMLIRPGTFKPPYDSGADLGAHSWAGDSWRTGGAPVWGWMSYDRELDLIYYGTGNPLPTIPSSGSGTTSGAPACWRAGRGTAALVWAYQFTPHDNWDYDATGAMILADLTIAGRPVKALVHFDKNGFAYTLDRTNGRLLVAAAFAPVTWARSVDLGSGRPVLDTSKRPGLARATSRASARVSRAASAPRRRPRTRRARIFSTRPPTTCAWTTRPARASHLKGTPFIGVDSPTSAGPAATSAASSRGMPRAAGRSGRTRSNIRTGAARW